ncbi:hypothetical protein BRC82_04845 [Halobacteriales archaeon QS_1_67_19]|nr:MAG: hypothetical protein BRC82_04845 [Halobacteriales archaeon QS_1_67_19]
MDRYERELLDDAISQLSASIGNALREGFETEAVLEEKDELTDFGAMWVQGYLVGQLATLRAISAGNPNVSPADIEEIGALVAEHDSRIASEIYS